jgi:predicted permease
MTMEVVLPAPRYDGARMSAFFLELVQAASRMPGVDQAGGTSSLPLTGSNSTDGYLVEGRPPADPREIPEAATRTVTPGYLAALRIPLLAGRDLSSRDTAAAPPVVLVNRAFADRYWGVARAVGKRIFFASPGARRVPFEVVGVVGDVRHLRLDAPVVPEIYVGYAQRPYDDMVLVVRSRAGVAQLAPRLRAEVARLDPDLPVFNVRTMRRVMRESTSAPRFHTAILSVFAGLGLVLALGGIYGVIAYSVVRRRLEFGIRLALGAPRTSVLGLVLKETASLAGIGIAAGLLLSLAATRALASLLFGVEPGDPGVLLATAAVVAAGALAAGSIPAARAARIAPATALQER